jgi:hypothetical protein
MESIMHPLQKSFVIFFVTLSYNNTNENQNSGKNYY